MIRKRSGYPEGATWKCILSNGARGKVWLMKLFPTHEQWFWNVCHSDGKSGIKGVTWGKFEKKWVAQLTFDKKHYLLGLFSDKKDAGIAYNNKIEELLVK